MQKPSTGKFTPASAARGTLLPISRNRSGTVKKANPHPAAPPTKLRMVLSTKSWRTILLRAAPRATRIDSSRSRSRTRASSRLAILPQATRSTSRTALKTIFRRVPVGPSTEGQFALHLGRRMMGHLCLETALQDDLQLLLHLHRLARVKLLALTCPSRSASAWPRLLIELSGSPGLSLTADVVHKSFSGAETGNRNDRGITPIMVNGCPLN